MTDRPILRLTHPEPSEAVVQRAVLHALRLHPRVGMVWRANAAAGHLRYPGGMQSQFMRFGFKGQPDIIGHLKDGRALYVEVKRPTGKLTPEQMDFIAQAQAHGTMAFVARRAQDVMDALA